MEIGGGRKSRQPGQIRKKAAVTSFSLRVAVRSPPFPFLGIIMSIDFDDDDDEFDTEVDAIIDDQTDDMFGAPTPAKDFDPSDDGEKRDWIKEGQAANQKPYLVLARKYRPQNFDDLIGQEAMVRTLTNAFKQNRIAHAFMPVAYTHLDVYKRQLKGFLALCLFGFVQFQVICALMDQLP